jgi:PEP-CTERM/exosortase A-associated glycosyltransferase
MKVVHILQHSLPTLAGYTIRADGILRAQMASGLDVVALTGPSQDRRCAGEDVIGGIRYLRSPGHAKGGRPGWREWKLHRGLLAGLRRVVEQEKPDLLHVHSPAYNALSALKVARERGLSCVYEMRAVWEDAAVDRGRFAAGSLPYRSARALETYVLRRADAVVTICEGLRQEVLARGLRPEKIFVVPNAVDMTGPLTSNSDFSLLRQENECEGPVFGFIGSLFRYEGVEQLLKVFPAVLERVPTARLLLVGSGERESQIKALAARWRRSRQVIWYPRISHDRVSEFYSAVDCCVYPRQSIRLTNLVTPLKPLEAMAMGKAVVASDVGGHRELIDHGHNGLLFPSDDPSALAETLCRVAEEPQTLSRLGRAGRDFVSHERTWEAVVANCQRAYSAALRRKREGSAIDWRRKQ